MNVLGMINGVQAIILKNIEELNDKRTKLGLPTVAFPEPFTRSMAVNIVRFMTKDESLP